MTDTFPIQTAMLIDDESFDQKLYQRIISRSGLVAEIMPFLYADLALDYLKSSDCKPIDVIFLDINMPRMNGFEFLEAATEQLGPSFARIVVVMLTTSLEERDRDRARSYPVVRKFIHKPLTSDHLIEVATLVTEAKALLAAPGRRSA